MRALLLVGSLAAGVLFFVYEYYCRRENNHNEQPHGGIGRSLSDEEYIVIGGSEASQSERRPRLKAPGPDEMCAICLETLIRRDVERKYAIIALPHCGHWFHQKCAIRLLDYHPMCPVCRVEIDGRSLRNTPVRLTQELNEGTRGDQNASTSDGPQVKSKGD